MTPSPPFPPAQAFSHWSYHNTNGQKIVVDIQGVGDLYTDPQVRLPLLPTLSQQQQQQQQPPAPLPDPPWLCFSLRELMSTSALRHLIPPCTRPPTTCMAGAAMQIHTRDGEGYGTGNLGARGMALFFRAHKCNAICHQLGLEPFPRSETLRIPIQTQPPLLRG